MSGGICLFGVRIYCLLFGVLRPEACPSSYFLGAEEAFSISSLEAANGSFYYAFLRASSAAYYSLRSLSFSAYFLNLLSSLGLGVV